MFDLIVYHGDCPDGWCAAYIAKKACPKAELYPATHGHKPPFELAANKNVLVVDFSWKFDDMAVFAQVCKSLVVLDHHKTAQAELEPLGQTPSLYSLYVEFDMNRSGAAMAWDYLHPGVERPWWVNYVMDRDLWRWKEFASKEVSAYLMATPHTIEAWDKLTATEMGDAIKAGLAITKHIDKYIAAIVAQAQMGQIRWPNGSQKTVAIVNAAYPNISDVCNELCKVADVGVGWFERKDGLFQFSVRSEGDLDISWIATLNGGGGHKNAAGFQLKRQEAFQLLDQWKGRISLTDIFFEQAA